MYLTVTQYRSTRRILGAAPYTLLTHDSDPRRSKKHSISPHTLLLTHLRPLIDLTSLLRCRFERIRREGRWQVWWI